jgi:WD40 repeat protein
MADKRGVTAIDNGDRDETVASVSFSPDGTRLYSVSTEGPVRIWETRRAVESESGGAE